MPPPLRPAPGRETGFVARLTWDEREQVILEAIADAEVERGEDIERVDKLVDITGLPRVQVLLGVRALRESAYVTAVDAGGANDTADGDFLAIALLERGRRATGQWPADGGDALIKLLESRVAASTTEEERTRWERLRDAAKALGGKALSELSIAYLKHVAGL